MLSERFEMCMIFIEKSAQLIDAWHEPMCLTYAAGACYGFCSMNHLRVLLLPLDGMPVHLQVSPSNISPGPT